ncbi:NADP-dependent oxidoreductase domain-containing protein [Armillaria luteobubalina]|uniref:NADP-dependent oxidoreductase domain-containing protein n=1 Tax=Armillaria luteobubalina TaxID=153913 RepID=A0AA39P5P4_9AGAR|nr:NADP-dependent oxidoreductase domain-containing protein [Armillaria luteobubalina]
MAVICKLRPNEDARLLGCLFAWLAGRGAYTVSEVTLGSSGLKVSKIILGCAVYGSPDWYSRVQNEEESIKQIKAAYDAGINTFDTANVYSNGQSEVILGKAIKQENLPRDGIVVMTKVRVCSQSELDLYPLQVFHPVSRNIHEHLDGKATEYADTHRYVNQYGLSRKHIFDAVKKSLERLQLDYIDVLHCQEYDTTTPMHETMKALHDVVQLGWVRYVGMSNCRAWQFHAMQNYAIANHLTPFISMQNDYNLLYREDEKEMLPTLKYFDVGSIPWTSLARGAMVMTLDEQFEQLNDGRIPGGRKDWHNTIINRVEDIALQRNATMTQVAIAWSLGKQYVCALVINAPETLQLLNALGGMTLVLTAAEVQYLEEPYKPQMLRH